MHHRHQSTTAHSAATASYSSSASIMTQTTGIGGGGPLSSSSTTTNNDSNNSGGKLGSSDFLGMSQRKGHEDELRRHVTDLQNKIEKFGHEQELDEELARVQASDIKFAVLRKNIAIETSYRDRKVMEQELLDWVSAVKVRDEELGAELKFQDEMYAKLSDEQLIEALAASSSEDEETSSSSSDSSTTDNESREKKNKKQKSAKATLSKKKRSGGGASSPGGKTKLASFTGKTNKASPLLSNMGAGNVGQVFAHIRKAVHMLQVYGNRVMQLSKSLMQKELSIEDFNSRISGEMSHLNTVLKEDGSPGAIQSMIVSEAKKKQQQQATLGLAGGGGAAGGGGPKGQDGEQQQQHDHEEVVELHRMIKAQKRMIAELEDTIDLQTETIEALGNQIKTKDVELLDLNDALQEAKKYSYYDPSMVKFSRSTMTTDLIHTDSISTETEKVHIVEDVEAYERMKRQLEEATRATPTSSDGHGGTAGTVGDGTGATLAELVALGESRILGPHGEPLGTPVTRHNWLFRMFAADRAARQAVMAQKRNPSSFGKWASKKKTPLIWNQFAVAQIINCAMGQQYRALKKKIAHKEFTLRVFKQMYSKQREVLRVEAENLVAEKQKEEVQKKRKLESLFAQKVEEVKALMSTTQLLAAKMNSLETELSKERDKSAAAIASGGGGGGRRTPSSSSTPNSAGRSATPTTTGAGENTMPIKQHKKEVDALTSQHQQLVRRFLEACATMVLTISQVHGKCSARAQAAMSVVKDGGGGAVQPPTATTSTTIVATPRRPSSTSSSASGGGIASSPSPPVATSSSSPIPPGATATATAAADQLLAAWKTFDTERFFLAELNQLFQKCDTKLAKVCHPTTTELSMQLDQLLTRADEELVVMDEMAAASSPLKKMNFFGGDSNSNNRRRSGIMNTTTPPKTTSSSGTSKLGGGGSSASSPAGTTVDAALSCIDKIGLGIQASEGQIITMMAPPSPLPVEDQQGGRTSSQGGSSSSAAPSRGTAEEEQSSNGGAENAEAKPTTTSAASRRTTTTATTTTTTTNGATSSRRSRQDSSLFSGSTTEGGGGMVDVRAFLAGIHKEMTAGSNISNHGSGGGGNSNNIISAANEDMTLEATLNQIMLGLDRSTGGGTPDNNANENEVFLNSNASTPRYGISRNVTPNMQVVSLQQQAAEAEGGALSGWDGGGGGQGSGGGGGGGTSGGIIPAPTVLRRTTSAKNVTTATATSASTTTPSSSSAGAGQRRATVSAGAVTASSHGGQQSGGATANSSIDRLASGRTTRTRTVSLIGGATAAGNQSPPQQIVVMVVADIGIQCNMDNLRGGSSSGVSPQRRGAGDRRMTWSGGSTSPSVATATASTTRRGSSSSSPPKKVSTTNETSAIGVDGAATLTGSPTRSHHHHHHHHHQIHPPDRKATELYQKHEATTQKLQEKQDEFKQKRGEALLRQISLVTGGKCGVSGGDAKESGGGGLGFVPKQFPLLPEPTGSHASIQQAAIIVAPASTITSTDGVHVSTTGAAAAISPSTMGHHYTGAMGHQKQKGKLVRPHSARRPPPQINATNTNTTNSHTNAAAAATIPSGSDVDPSIEDGFTQLLSERRAARQQQQQDQHEFCLTPRGAVVVESTVAAAAGGGTGNGFRRPMSAKIQSSSNAATAISGGGGGGAVTNPTGLSYAPKATAANGGTLLKGREIAFYVPAPPPPLQ